MRARMASLWKLDAILDVAERDNGFASALRSSPEKAVAAQSIDLSASEQRALVDILTGGKISSLSTPPPGCTTNRIEALQKRWRSI